MTFLLNPNCLVSSPLGHIWKAFTQPVLCLPMCWKYSLILNNQDKSLKANFPLHSIWVPTEPDILGDDKQCLSNKGKRDKKRLTCGKIGTWAYQPKDRGVDVKGSRPVISGRKSWRQVGVQEWTDLLYTRENFYENTQMPSEANLHVCIPHCLSVLCVHLTVSVNVMSNL